MPTITMTTTTAVNEIPSVDILASPEHSLQLWAMPDEKSLAYAKQSASGAAAERENETHTTGHDSLGLGLGLVSGSAFPTLTHIRTHTWKLDKYVVKIP